MRWRAVVTYRKGGRLRYLSHLDVARAFERALRRAGWPVAYTEGFHQRMRVSLGPPLPVGAEGEAELLAVTLAERVSDEWALGALRAQMPDELGPTGVVIQPERAQSPLKFVRRATYVMELEEAEGADREAVAAAVERLMGAERVELAAKDGGTVEVRERIYAAAVAPDAPPVRVRVCLGVAQDNYLSPDRFLEALAQFMEPGCHLRWRRLVRTGLYTQ